MGLGILRTSWRRSLLLLTLVRRQQPVETDPDVETGVGDERKIDRSGPRIRCPLCSWQPGKDDRWACKCGHIVEHV